MAGDDAAPLHVLPTVELHRKDNGQLESTTLNWRTAPDFSKKYDALEYMREWTSFFRDRYRSVADKTDNPAHGS